MQGCGVATSLAEEETNDKLFQKWFMQFIKYWIYVFCVAGVKQTVALLLRQIRKTMSNSGSISLVTPGGETCQHGLPSPPCTPLDTPVGYCCVGPPDRV